MKSAIGYLVTTAFVGLIALGGCGPGNEPDPCEEAHEVSSTAEIFCGGFANIQCPGGLTCIDDPFDACDPQNGGADCGGICQDLIYVGDSPEQCQVIKFSCDPGFIFFSDDCGCGCQWAGTAAVNQ